MNKRINYLQILISIAVVIQLCLWTAGCEKTTDEAPAERSEKRVETNKIDVEKRLEMALLNIEKLDQQLAKYKTRVVSDYLLGSWQYPAGQEPGFSLKFKPDGSLTFTDGFKWYNPARWEYDYKNDLLILHSDKFTSEDLDEFKLTKQVKKVNYEKKSVYFRFDEETKYLNIHNHYCYKQLPAEN